jgi:predicted transglutaminase-like cysteine proteinase
MLTMLQQVLDQAHAGHTYVTDQVRHGLPEHWAPELVGDCDSFALWCRDQLKSHGIETSLVYCRTETGEGHLVCSTADGWVLDNRHAWVTRRDALPYTWISLGHPDGQWLTITG